MLNAVAYRIPEGSREQLTRDTLKELLSILMESISFRRSVADIIGSDDIEPFWPEITAIIREHWQNGVQLSDPDLRASNWTCGPENSSNGGILTTSNKARVVAAASSELCRYDLYVNGGAIFHRRVV